jgi:hypothetical protein
MKEKIIPGIVFLIGLILIYIASRLHPEFYALILFIWACIIMLWAILKLIPEIPVPEKGIAYEGYEKDFEDGKHGKDGAGKDTN